MTKLVALGKTVWACTANRQEI